MQFYEILRGREMGCCETNISHLLNSGRYLSDFGYVIFQVNNLKIYVIVSIGFEMFLRSLVYLLTSRKLYWG